MAADVPGVRRFMAQIAQDIKGLTVARLQFIRMMTVGERKGPAPDAPRRRDSRRRFRQSAATTTGLWVHAMAPGAYSGAGQTASGSMAGEGGPTPTLQPRPSPITGAHHPRPPPASITRGSGRRPRPAHRSARMPDSMTSRMPRPDPALCPMTPGARGLQQTADQLAPHAPAPAMHWTTARTFCRTGCPFGGRRRSQCTCRSASPKEP